MRPAPIRPTWRTLLKADSSYDAVTQSCKGYLGSFAALRELTDGLLVLVGVVLSDKLGASVDDGRNALALDELDQVLDAELAHVRWGLGHAGVHIAGQNRRRRVRIGVEPDHQDLASQPGVLDRLHRAKRHV